MGNGTGNEVQILWVVVLATWRVQMDFSGKNSMDYWTWCGLFIEIENIFYWVEKIAKLYLDKIPCM
jgi:hypothetical protein